MYSFMATLSIENHSKYLAKYLKTSLISQQSPRFPD